MNAQQMTSLYAPQIARLHALFDQAFPDAALNGPFVFSSAPGRVELAGNHTDHQGGRVISAAIGERMYALTRPNGTSVVRVAMEGFGYAQVDLAQPGWHVPRFDERGTSKALVRGMLAVHAAHVGELDGFDMVTVSDVPAGFGVSSSAAFEMLVGAAVEALWCTSDESAAARASVFPRDPLALALAGVSAERDYFGKPCGAQDQVTCAHGGVVAMEFQREIPVVTPVTCDFASSGYTAFLVDSACDHSVFNHLFAVIPAEMAAVADLFGASRLVDIDPARVVGALPEVRSRLGDRAALRALHFFDENARVTVQRDALTQGDYESFLANVRLSGASSAQYLQNVSSVCDDAAARYQPAMVVLALCAHILGERGAWRIHGGGFGGSVLAFAPNDAAKRFASSMDGALGRSACRLVAPGGPGACAARLS